MERDAVTPDARATPGFGLCLLMLGGLTIVRLIGLHFSVVDLFFDESQYWAWSRELAFGYFSKPPLLAWIIAASDAVCGSGEACTRSAAPLLYLGTSLLCYAIADTLYGKRVAFWSALMVAMAPGIVFSTRIISTDVPLLLFWALALLAYIKLVPPADAEAAGATRRDEGRSSWAVVLGLAFGFGMLAKYAMIYFLLGVAIHALLDRKARAWLRSPAPWLALGIGIVVLLPNIWWNVDNGFVTLRHTGDNIQGGGATFDIGNGLEFIASQFGVAGPIVFGGLLVLLSRIASPALSAADRLLLAFAIPALSLVSVTGFITHANANWAAPSLVTAIIVVTAWLVRQDRWRMIFISLAIGAVAQIALLAGDAFADNITLPGLRDADPYARTMGWRALGEKTLALAARVDAKTIVADQRDSESSLIYYARAGGRPVLAWATTRLPDHQFDITRRFSETAPEPILFISRCPATARLTEQFADVTPLGRFDTATGPTSVRPFFAFRLSGRRGTIVPLSACR
jgi:4-amino-4-deoxy-L-arabinose transferase-like glycosyltransferase